MQLNGNILRVAFVAALIATVASVPTSVLVQNSELATATANNKGPSVLMSKVKRSSTKDNNAQQTVGNYGSTATAGNNVAATSTLNKKSSPEIVPALFNSPAVTSQQQQQQQQSTQQQQQQPLPAATSNAGLILPTDEEILNSAIAAGLTAAAVAGSGYAVGHQSNAPLYANEDLYEETAPQAAMMHKRGINSQQYLYGLNGGLLADNGLGSYGSGSNSDLYNNPYVSLASAGMGGGAAMVPNGIWADEMDPTIVYTDLQDIDDYAPAPRAPYRNKAYDNLQNLLNAEAYLEPVVMPAVQRYYGLVGNGDRNKRFNMNRFNKYNDMRPKRDTKLTPADMLALVALVEAGERARKDTDSEPAWLDNEINPKAYQNANLQNYNYNNGYDYPSNIDDIDYNGAAGLNGVAGGTWFDPSVVDYYNVEQMPKYEVAHERKYGGANAGANRYPSSKRFMVAKKKRSLGKFLNEPVAKPSFNFNTNNNEKYFK